VVSAFSISVFLALAQAVEDGVLKAEAKPERAEMLK
jgi:hypothetical protein